MGLGSPDNGPVKESQGRTILDVSVNLVQLGVTLFKMEKPLALLEVSKVDTKVSMKKRTMTAVGGLGSLLIRDLTHKSHLYNDAFSTVGQQLIKFTYSTFSAREKTFPGYDSLIKIDMSSIKLVFLYRFFGQLLEFFAEYNETRASLIQNLHNVTPKKDSKMKMELLISNPFLLVPRSSASGSCFVAEIKDIHISNTYAFCKAPFLIIFRFLEKTDDMAINITGMNFCSKIFTEPDSSVQAAELVGQIASDCETY